MLITKRLSIWRRLFFTSATLVAMSSVHAAVLDSADYDHLIRQARAGDRAPVLAYFNQVEIQGPVGQRYVSDWIAVESWAGHDVRVADLYTRWVPVFALSASANAIAGRALRNLRRWDASIEAYQRALSIEPASTAFRIGLVHVMADAGRDEQALNEARRLWEGEPKDPQRILALAYVHTAAKRFYEALEWVSRARLIAPSDPQVERAYIDALQSAGLPTQALAVNAEAAQPMSQSQVLVLRADAAAELVRLAYQPTTTEAERFQAADAALAMYTQLLETWSALPGPAASRQVERIRIDRIGALTARAYMQAAVAEYEDLLKSNVEVPDYAKSWVAGAYLYLRNPAAAKALYAQVLARNAPGSSRAAGNASGLFYALSEVGEKREAEQLAEQTAAALPPTLRVVGSPLMVPNDVWAGAQEQAAQGKSFADDTPAAQARFEELLALAPGSSSLRTALAGVYRSRAWPRRAELELKLTESLAPRALEVELQQGFTALDLSEWEHAELLSSDTLARFPENLQVQRLARMVEVQNKAELRVSGSRGLSSDSPVTGNADRGLDTVLYSAPIQRNWRVFAGAGWAEGEFPEGDGRHRTLRIGADWRARDNSAEVEISNHEFGHGNRLGVRLQGAHDLNDFWQIGGALEKFSRDTPLRALHSNVTADSVNLTARWRASHRREWRLTLQPMRFSDGNSRLSASLLGRERVYTAPYFTVDLGVEAAASRGERQDVPYYNPAADFTLVPRLDFSHVMYQWYENEWRQQLQLGAGTYHQRGFGSGPVYFLGYSQRLRLNDVFEAGLGISVTRRPYDGIRERIVRGTFDLSMRF